MAVILTEGATIYQDKEGSSGNAVNFGNIQSMSKTAFTNVNVIDGQGGQISDVTVLVHDKTIHRIAATADTKNPSPEYKTLDGQGKWLMPGLVNCHDHLLNKSLRTIADGSTDASAVKAWRMQMFLSSPGYLALECAKNAQWELEQGVTTIRELGGPAVPDQASPPYTNVDLRDAIANGLNGPRILACRLAIAMTGGHGHPWYGIREADGVEEVRKAVREQLKGGADVIKIMSSAGTANYPHEHPGMAEFTVEELTVAVEEAHRRETPVTTHAMSDEAARNSLKAGVDTIEHGFLIGGDTVQRMADAGVSFVPTATVCKRIATSGSGPMAELFGAALPGYGEQILKAAEMGIPVGVGTDSRHTMLEEMNTLSKFGMSPMDVLTAATSVGAKICGLPNAGVVADGYIADLVLLDFNPLDDLAKAFENVRLVMKEGEVVVDSR